MTRKISKEEKNLRKVNWQMKKSLEALDRLSRSARAGMDDMVDIGYLMTGRPLPWRAHRKETPERTKMHAQYARKKGRA